jgi:hypothetical protein
MNMKRFWKKRYIIPAAIVAAPVVFAVFVLLGGGVVMLLWNWLLPPLFGWPQITVWQGFGLLALCRILFGGFGGGGGHSKDITPEERERFRHRMSDRFCSSPNETPGPRGAPGNSRNPRERIDSVSDDVDNEAAR